MSQTAEAAKPEKITTRVTIIKADDNPMGQFGIDAITAGYSQSELDAMAQLRLIAPSLRPDALYDIVERSSVVGPCIDAYAAGISGTGYEVVHRMTDDELEQQKVNVTQAERDFMERDADTLRNRLANPFPEIDFVQLRRSLRADAEHTGMSYVEVVHNAAGKPMFLRTQPSTRVLSTGLTKAVMTDVVVVDGLKVTKVRMPVRFRKYLLKLGKEKLWYKDHKCPYHIDAISGSLYANLPVAKRGNTLIPFYIKRRTPYDPYGKPRWLNGVPNVLGLRSSEELNMGFFDAGGVPPTLLFVAGGAFTTESVRQQVENILGGRGGQLRAAVVEVDSTGALDSNQVPKISTESFSSTDQNDPMYDVYSKATKKSVRELFRLSPLFLGGAEEYSHAAATTALISTESMVFSPEREDEDRFFNRVIFPYLGIYGARMMSRPLVFRDPDKINKAIDLVLRSKGIVVPAANLITELNRVGGMSLKLAPGYEEANVTGLISIQGTSGDPNSKEPDAAVKEPSDPASGGTQQ